MDDENVEPVGRDSKGAQTYVVLRPRYGVGDDPFSFEKFIQKEVSYVRSEEAWIPRRDPKMDFKGRFERDRKWNLIVPARPLHVPKPGGMMREENRRTLTIPVIHRKHGTPPRATIYSLFRQYAYDYEVKIGVDPNDMHTNYRGDTVSYAGLFKALKDYDFHPLAPLEDDKTRERFERSLAALIYKEVQSAIRSKVHKNINHIISSWAINVRDYVRDYIRGSVSASAIGKENLKDRTITGRRSKQRHYPKATYRYGYANALWETGTLESAIKVLEVKAVRRMTSSKLAMLGKKEAEVETSRRKDERNSRKYEEARKRTDEALGIGNASKPKTPPPRPTSVAKTIRDYERDLKDKKLFYDYALATLVSNYPTNFRKVITASGDETYTVIGITLKEQNSRLDFMRRHSPEVYSAFKNAAKEYQAAQVAFNIASNTDRIG